MGMKEDWEKEVGYKHFCLMLPTYPCTASHRSCVSSQKGNPVSQSSRGGRGLGVRSWLGTGSAAWLRPTPGLKFSGSSGYVRYQHAMAMNDTSMPWQRQYRSGHGLPRPEADVGERGGRWGR